MGLLYLLVGIVIGALLSGLFMRTIFSKNNTDSQNKINILETERQLAMEKQRAAYADLEGTKADYMQRMARLEQELAGEREKSQNANTRLARSEETFRNMQENEAKQKVTYQERMQELTDTQKKFTTEFENVANRLLDEKSKKFTEQNRTQLDIILSPLKDKLKDFEDKVEKTYKAESDERISLKTEIKQLVELNKQLSLDATNLTNALKVDTKKQGNWGEVVLERVLEASGLRKGEEYELQYSTENEDGTVIRPDVLVKLPEDKHLVIDSKVSLTAYEAFSSATTDDDRQRYLKDHVDSVRRHIKQLSEKKYHTGKDLHMPEFVLLFVPLESSFSLAIQADYDLFNFAWDKKIVIVSPTTLLATLSTVASLWKQERRTKNAEEIAKLGGRLYDQLFNFIGDMERVEGGLKTAQKGYEDAMKKLSVGSDTLTRKAQRLKELGAKAEKSIPDKYLDNKDINEQPIIENL